jgi:glutathione S-transferase
MKLYYAAASPFVRKCLICAHELGVRDRIALEPAAPHPVNRDRSVVARNPLGKIPTLITDGGEALYDSKVICEYLNSLADGHLLPVAGSERWRALVDQSLADGMMDAAILTRYETVARPESLRWNDWITGQLAKVHSGLEQFEQRALALAGRVDIGTITLGCALGYLDFRFAALPWRDHHPGLARWYAEMAKRESFAATQPV